MMNAIVKDVIFYVIENNTSFQIGDTNGIKQELVVVVLVDYIAIFLFVSSDRSSYSDSVLL